MKKTMMLIVLSIAIYGNIEAKGNFIPAILFLQDGTQIECFAAEMVNWRVAEITYKESKNSKEEKKIKSVDIKKIAYVNEDGDTSEWEYLPTISPVALSKGQQIIDKPMWLNVKMRGFTTLYLNTTSEYKKQKIGKDGYIYTKGYNYLFFCLRENEEAAANVLYVMDGKVPVNYSFAKSGSNYFADSPEIAEKIRKKEKGYREGNIVEIVREYNAEKLANQ